MHSLGTEVCVVRGRPSGGDEALGSWDTRTNLACGAKGGVPPLGGAAGQYLLKLALLPPSTSVSAWGGAGGRVPWGTGQRRGRSPLAQSRHPLNSGFSPSLAPPPLAGWGRRKSTSEGRVMCYCK